MTTGKRPLPGEHGDSIDYKNLNLLLITMGIGIALGIVFFTSVL
ncbi:hypothetical protein QQM79_08420 [Marinobacteraceae bacterium S3BR75-40.1]